MRLDISQDDGIDFAVDDLEVYQLPKSCITQVDFPFVVPTGKAFTGSVTGHKDITCAGGSNGQITIAASNFDPVYGFDYSIDGGSNWVNSKVSPVTVTGLTAKTYTPLLRYNLAGACPLTLDPVTIKVPNPIVVRTTQTPATCLTNGGATVDATTTTGGTGAYTIKLKNNVSPFTVTNFPANGILTNVAPGNYTVLVTDANGCTQSVNHTITISAPAIPTASIDPTSTLCFDSTTGSSIKVNVTGGVGPYTYTTTFNGGTPSAPSSTFVGPIFTYNATVIGNYSFDVYDVNGCKATTISQVINGVLTATTPVTTALDCDVAPANQALITGTISGGTAPFVVTLISGTGGNLVQPVGNGNTFTYTNSVANTYKFQIKDANNCITTSTAVINALVAVTGKAIVTDETCGTPNNGSVTLEALTGVSPFTYSFNGSVPSATTVTYGSLAGSLTGTSYPYQIKDAKGCVYNGTAKVFEPTPIGISASITTPYTCDNIDGATITATASNGNGGYTFVLKRGTTTEASNTTGVFPNLTIAGTYTVTVTDSKGCNVTSTSSMVINALNKPASMTISNSALSCPTNKATVTITNVKNSAGVVIAAAGLQYRIVSPTATVFQTSNSFAGLIPSTEYTFEVKDANNCRYSEKYTITALPVFTVDLKSSVNETCLNAADGSAIFTVSGLGNGINYSYIVDSRPSVSGVSPAGTSFDIPVAGLSVGPHTITVKNTTTTCSVPANVTITGATAVLKLNAPTLTHVTCLAKGTAIINAVGGWGTYTYTVTPKSPAGTAIVQVTNNKFIDLGAGTYSVSVKDLSGCTVAGADFTINDKVLPAASISATSVYCAGGTGGASLVVTPTVSAQPNYRYSINGSTPQVSGTFSGLTPGKYDIVVSDITTGCTLPLAQQTIALPMTASTRLLADLDCDVAPASPDASIEVTINNGYPDYKYRVNKTGAPFSGGYTNVGAGVSVFTYPAATAGTYYFEITDSKTCTTVVSRTINALVKPTFTFSQVNVNCKTAATGSITVTGVPASGTYTYILTPTAPIGSVVSQTTNVFNNLKAGVYSVQVKDDKKCLSDAQTVTITEPLIGLTATASLTTKLSCDTNNGTQAATITVTAINGTPYSGTDKYRYSYNGLPVVTSNTYTTSTVGTVSIVVYDANNCSYAVPVSPVVNTLNPPKTMTFAQANTITCDSALRDTDLTVSFLNGVSPFRVEITSTDAAVAPAAPVATGVTANNHTFANLASGTYYFKVTDANNCTLVGNYTINPVVTIQASGSIFTNVTCNGAANGVLKFTVSGNRTGGYTPTLVGSISGTITGGVNVSDVITYSNLKGGENYTFTVTNNATKCQDTDTVTLSQPTAITGLTANATKVFCSNLSTTITVSAVGGVSPLQYAVVKSSMTPVAADYNTTGIFTKDTSVDGLAYVAYVKDKNGNCPQNISVPVVKDVAPTVGTPAAQCYSGSSFTITMSGTVFAGSSKQYGIDGVYTTNPIKTISAAGSYKLTVKDDNGCISPVVVYDVKDLVTITARLDKDITCTTVPATATAAQITLSAGGGTSAYTYAYRLAPSTVYVSLPGNVYNPTVKGNYYFRVTSGGCSTETTSPVQVTDPVQPTATTSITNLSCYQAADGVVTLVPTAGAAPFMYSFNGSGFTTDATYSNLAVSTGLGYPYKVRDSKGCEVSGYAIVTQPAQINFTVSKTDMTCPGPTMGSVTVSAITNGVAPFVYTVRNIVTGAAFTRIDPTGAAYTFTGVSYGDYEVTVSDSKSCSNVKTNVQVLVPPSNLLIDLTTSASCATGATIIVTVNPAVIPAVPLYQFGIYDMAVSPYSSALLPPDAGFPLRHTFTNLTPGVTYTFVIYDPSTNCYYFQTASGPVASATPLRSSATAIPVACKGTPTGGVSFTISNTNATQVNYTIFKDQTAVSTGISGLVTFPFTTATKVVGLNPGKYYMKFTEINGSYAGCTSSSLPFTVVESAVDLTLVATSPKNDNCKNNAGQIVAIPSGGTGPYLYQIVADNGVIGFGAGDTAPTSDSFVSPTHSASTFNVESGNYIVWVKDAYGCIANATRTVALDPDPVFALAVPNKCATEGNFTVNVTVTDAVPTMAPYTVSVNGGAFVSFSGLTYPATGLNSGLQTIIIKSKNDCPVGQPITIAPTPVATAVVSKQLDCSVTPTTVANAAITVTVTKGTSPYTYEVKKGSGSYTTITPSTTVLAGVTTFTYSVPSANADTYQFRITDSNTCPIETNPVVIDPIVPIVPASNPIQSLCKGGSGTIELSATGGKGPYTYNFNGLGFSTQTVYSVIAGTYSYIVKDALGCDKTSNVTLGEPTAVVLGTPVITPLKCGPSNQPQAATVDLTLVASGGTGSFEYSFAGSAFSNKKIYTVDDTGADQLNIPYKVKDANGCEKSGTVNIYKLYPPTNFSFTPGPVITCATLSSSVSIINVVNAVGPITAGLTYKIISPSSATSNITGATSGIFSNLAPGNYVFQVTYTATGCVKQLPYEIKDVVKINIAVQSTTGITCSTAADGKASFFVSGFGTGVGTYRYELDGVAVAGNFSNPTINLIGLAKGAHTIKVIDNATTCSKLINFNIASPTTALTAPKVVTPLGCTTFGAVKITAAGGWGNYVYTVTPPTGSVLTNNTGVFGGLTQTGSYTISVKDANGCVLSDSFTLLVPVSPSATIDVTSDYCYDGTNAAKLVVNATTTSTFVVTPYAYSIDNGQTWQASNTFNNLAPGNYIVKVKDAYGCISTAANTTIKPQLFATAQNTKDIFCTPGSVNGTIKIDAVGGYGSYTYTVAKDGAAASAPILFPSGSSTANYSVVAPGSYAFVVYDSKNCPFTIINKVVMVAPIPVTFTAIPTSPSCIGTQGNIGNGSILVTLAAGNNNPDYTYTIARTAPTVGTPKNQVNNGLFTGLIAGTYAVTVTSERGCSTAKTVVINPPVVVTATATASPFACSPTNTLNATTVTVRGTGGAGSGAVSDYTYSDNGTNWRTTNTFKVYDNGSTQNLTYFVKDANGCIDDVQIPIAKFPKLISATPSLVTKAACNNAGEVIKVDIVGGASPSNFVYQVAVDGGAYSTPAIAIAAGTLTFNYTATNAGHSYRFKITDLTTNCSIISTAYNVPLFDLIRVTASSSANVSCNGGNNGAIQINIIDYKGPYTYEVLKGGVSLIPAVTGSGNSSVTSYLVLPSVLKAGTDYTVKVTETAFPNCNTTSNVVVITEPTVLTLSTAITVVNKNCTTTGAKVTVPITSIGGGTPGYTYAFVPSGTSPTGLFTSVNTKTLPTTKISPAFDLWDVYVQDANGCSAVQTIKIATDPIPVITNVTATQCPTATGYNITVTATAFSSFLEYSLDGNSFQSSNVLTVTSPGDYTVTVRDANTCTATAITPVTILKPLGLQGIVSKLPTCNAIDGEITLTATDGSGNYEYSKDGLTYSSAPLANVFGGLGANTYTLYVRDLNTLCVKSVRVVIDPASVVTGMKLSKTDVTCKGESDGSITVALAASTQTVNNNPPYTYSLSGTTVNGTLITKAAQGSNVFDNLEAGNYTVITTSARGCSATASITVIEPAVITVPAPTLVQFGCVSGNTSKYATITVSGVSGGSGTYSIYEFIKGGTVVQSGASNVYTETNLSGGTYTVNVYDNKGCLGSTVAPIIIAPFTPIDKINQVVNQAINCINRENITVTAVDATGTAIAGIQYSLVDISGAIVFIPNTTGIFTGLAVGNYMITATNPVTGCSVQDVHYVFEPNTFDLTIDNIGDVSCFGGSNGTANVTIIDKTITAINPNQAGAFSYTLVAPNGTSTTGNSSVAGPLALTGLVAGTYTITATLINNPYCSVSKVFTITQPTAALKISETHTPITCVTGNNDGSISANAIGGWPGGYEFQLELASGTVVTPWRSSSYFPNLIAGDYVVKVRDAKTCVDQVAVSLVNPTPIAAVLEADKLTLACFGDTNVTLTVQQPVTGGSGFYNYTLETTYPDGTVTLNGPQASNVFTNLGTASYKVIVSDTWGCSVVTNTVVISEPTIVTASLVKASAQTCLNAATLTLSAAGGTGPYTYSADANFTTVLGTFTSSVTFAVPLTTVEVNYLYYLKDSNGCVSFNSNNIAVIPLEPLEFKYENENPYINCLGDNNGQIIAIAKGGSGNYIYTLFDGSGNVITPTPVQLEPGHFTQLLAGNYLVEVKSGDCTSARKPITITQPETALIYTPVVTDVTCNGNGDGKLEITASGGTGVIKFALSPDLDKFLDSGTFLNLKVGHYEAIIQDERGCNHVYEFDINEPLPIGAIVDPLSIKQELCYGEKTGEFAITISGGIAPYSTSIDGDTFVADRVLFAGLTGGKHTVIVKDAHLCEMPFDVLLDPSVLLTPVATVSNDCVNDLPANKVTVTIDSSNIAADVKYSLDSTGIEQASNVFTNLIPGDHFIMVHHKNGCVDATDTFTIDKIDPLTISIGLGGLNEIVATVTGGSGVYQYTVNGESIGSNNKYYYFRSGDYTVTVTDSNGCSMSATKYFEFIDIKIPPIFTPTGDGTNDNWKPTNTENYPDIKFVVYDRYGRQVGTFGAGQSWDGKYNGTELPMGDYWYVLKLRHSQDDREFIGHFTLYR
ncbi:MAG TPA: T9SS type B sorting domain-containing protein [Flavobacterium sp.]|nr:T9SS type B sorting domain-containing protein [Flavobacterium sp.]